MKDFKCFSLTWLINTGFPKCFWGGVPAGVNQLDGSSWGRRGERWTALGHIFHDTLGGGAGATGSGYKARPHVGFASGVGHNGGVPSAYCDTEKKHTGL